MSPRPCFPPWERKQTKNTTHHVWVVIKICTSCVFVHSYDIFVCDFPPPLSISGSIIVSTLFSSLLRFYSIYISGHFCKKTKPTITKLKEMYVAFLLPHPPRSPTWGNWVKKNLYQKTLTHTLNIIFLTVCLRTKCKFTLYSLNGTEADGGSINIIQMCIRCASWVDSLQNYSLVMGEKEKQNWALIYVIEP